MTDPGTGDPPARAPESTNTGVRFDLSAANSSTVPLTAVLRSFLRRVWRLRVHRAKEAK